MSPTASVPLFLQISKGYLGNTLSLAVVIVIISDYFYLLFPSQCTMSFLCPQQLLYPNRCFLLSPGPHLLLPTLVSCFPVCCACSVAHTWCLEQPVELSLSGKVLVLGAATGVASVRSV